MLLDQKDKKRHAFGLSAYCLQRKTSKQVIRKAGEAGQLCRGCEGLWGEMLCIRQGPPGTANPQCVLYASCTNCGRDQKFRTGVAELRSMTNLSDSDASVVSSLAIWEHQFSHVSQHSGVLIKNIFYQHYKEKMASFVFLLLLVS